MNGRITVHGPDEDLDLTLHGLGLLLVVADDGEGADAFPVKAHVLGEGLGQEDLVAVFYELAHGLGILVAIATGETLVCHVKVHQCIATLQTDSKMQHDEEKRIQNQSINGTTDPNNLSFLHTLRIFEISAHCSGLGSTPTKKNENTKMSRRQKCEQKMSHVPVGL